MSQHFKTFAGVIQGIFRREFYDVIDILHGFVIIH